MLLITRQDEVDDLIAYEQVVVHVIEHSYPKLAVDVPNRVEVETDRTSTLNGTCKAWSLSAIVYRSSSSFE